jgi:APA family basic amino acid/polyamine antiporter
VIHFRRERILGSFRTPLYPYLPIIAIVAIFAFFFGLPTSALIIGLVMLLALTVVYYFIREEEHKKVVRIKLFK